MAVVKATLHQEQGRGESLNPLYCVSTWKKGEEMTQATVWPRRTAFTLSG